MRDWFRSLFAIPTEVEKLKIRVEELERKTTRLADETLELIKQRHPTRSRRKPKEDTD